MNSDNIIPKLPKETVGKLQSAMLDVCLSYELGGDWRLTAKKAMNASNGFAKKSLQTLVDADEEGIERLSVVLTEGI